ncbi:MAG: sugar ABC transporter permease [Polyangiaceae bacterium]|nr:sugar ABC transporter permease [Polyangiaceae bacterium]
MRPRRRFDPYWMMAPTALLLGVFFFYPLVVAGYRSLFAWDLLTPPSYVGIDNYRSLFESGEIWRTFKVTLLFSVVVVTGSMLLGLGLALGLNRPGRWAAFVRSSVFSAYVVSWVSVALLWLWVLDADAGALTHLLRKVGLPTADWLGDPDVALYAVAGVAIWKVAGYSMVLFIAGLQDIPHSLYEAAALDGARAPSRFLHVTWPLLRPTTAFVATTSLLLTFQVFDVVRVMTQGGPVHATTVFVYAIYEQIFLNLRVGRASAEVVVFFFVLLTLTALQLWVWRRRGAA